MNENKIWRHCGTCKKAIPLEGKYFACEISSCKKNAYCSLECFSAHVPVFRHKDAWAIENTAPKEAVDASMGRIMASHLVNPVRETVSGAPKDILIVASKLKDYIRARSGMNTSASVMERLSEMIRFHCERAIEHAEREGRRTVMDRDFFL